MKYDGCAENIWNDKPTSNDLISRLMRFDGIDQKKAARLERMLRNELGVEIRMTQWSEVAYDEHIHPTTHPY